MKVLFAVSNESISETIIKKYQQMYKEIILSKNVYYFNAIIKELEKDKTYDRIVISEDLEPFTNNNYETIDNFIFEKLDNISDEASTTAGEDIPIILIATDRRTKSDNLLIKLFGIGVYSALLGQDRSIEEVCKLIQKPRSKKEAKVYYKIDSNDVDYKPENEADVSETEIQNILTHYKRLGRNEERYVESFDSIATQYTDQQLRVIIKFLPLNVKAVLEENSPRYQQLMSFEKPKTSKYGQYQNKNKTKLNNNTSKALSNNGIKVESIPSGEKKLTKPVIIPSANTMKRVQKVEKIEKPEEKLVQKMEEINVPDIEETNTQEPVHEIPEMVEETKKRRGRPRKIQPEIVQVEEKPKKGRGRPRKNPVEETIVEPEEDSMLPGFEEETENPEIEEKQTSSVMKPNNNESQFEEDTILSGFDDDVLPGFEDVNSNNYNTQEDNEENVLPGWEDDEQEQQEEPTINNNYNTNSYNSNNEEDFFNPVQNESHLQNYRESSANLESLLTRDKKIVALVGTSKNGTSFLVNNLAEVLSNQGIKTAILDLTENRNSYYIYTKNEEQLRKIAYDCTEKLNQGIAEGIKVNSNLDVYTSLPGEKNNIEDYTSILETLVKNYALILLDCDFSTQYGYLKEASEMYLVQSMDVLTIQPLTAYLRELKAKGILEPNKLRAVINKYTKVKGVTEKAIIGGMAFYNDPAMSFMTELFNRETIQYCVIPFDVQVYTKYLEGLINCNITLSGYSKEFINSLNKLANMVYPVIGNSVNSNKAKYSNPKYNKYAEGSTFSNDMNSTLDKMKRNY